MATTLKLRRGTTAEHATFTGAVGEVTVDTDKDVVVVHDGATAGGFPALRAGAGASVSSLTNSGNITFTGTGNRITGDFSNATVANRVAFQTSTANGATSIYILPNGTSPTSQFVAVNNSDPTNAGILQAQANSTEIQLRSGITGTGTYLPMTFYTGGSERMRIDTSGNVQIGTTTADGQVHIKAAAGQGVPLTLTNTDAGGNPQVVVKGSRTYQIGTGNSGSGFAGQLFFYDGTAAATRMLIDSSGNVGIGLTSPAAKLDVVGASGVTSFTGTSFLGMQVRGAASTNDYSGIGFSTTNQAAPTAKIAAYFSGSGSYLQFGTSNSYASGITNTAMTIDYNGNVGIGTTSPESFGGGHKTLELAGSTNTEGGVFKTATSGSAGSGSTGTEMIVFTDSVGGKINVASTHPLVLSTANAERARIDSSGNLLIGKTTTDSATNGISWGGGVGTVVYAGGAGDGPQVQIVNTTAAATVPNGFRWLSFRIGSSATEIGKIEKTSSTTVAYVTSSDYRLKENVIPLTGALQRIANLRPVQWDWKGQADGGEGFIAHELAEVCPQAVTGKKDAMEADGVTPRYQGVDTSFLVATLTAAIQEQQQMIETLQAEVAALKGA